MTGVRINDIIVCYIHTHTTLDRYDVSKWTVGNGLRVEGKQKTEFIPEAGLYSSSSWVLWQRSANYLRAAPDYLWDGKQSESEEI